MVKTEQDDDKSYNVVINHEEQYSIWPVECEPPIGWVISQPAKTRSEALLFIEEAWKDMRPLSLRLQMEAQ